MNLNAAIKLVADDTRENTDPSMDDRAAIASARTITPADLEVVDNATVREAYQIVMAASADDVARALR